MKKIILISGKAEHGKSTLAKYLKEQLENEGEKVATDLFAKYIKGYLRDFYGWDGVTKDEFYRTKLQQLGTDIIKEKLNYKAFHAKRLAEDIQIIGDDFDFIIIDDCRFKDEVYTMKAMFPEECIIVRVNRYGFKSKLTKDQLKHKSECDLDDFKFDYILDVNSDNMSKLYREYDRLLEDILY